MRVLTLFASKVAAPAKVVNYCPGCCSFWFKRSQFGSSQKHIVCIMEFSVVVLASTVDTHFRG